MTLPRARVTDMAVRVAMRMHHEHWRRCGKLAQSWKSESQQDVWIHMARAAIAAMRKPTDDQMYAGAKALAMEMQAPSATLMGIGYAAMIDAAIHAPR